MIHHGDLFNVLPTLDAESVDACVTDPPYGIGFMGREWDTFGEKEYKARSKEGYGNLGVLPGYGRGGKTEDRTKFIQKSNLQFQKWCEQWAREVFRVMKPGAYLVVCGAPRSYHRMACGVEDAGFVIRDKFAWLFGSGFPKNHNLGDGKGTALKPAHEPIALAWKPFRGSIRSCHETHGTAALNIDACRIEGEPWHREPGENPKPWTGSTYAQDEWTKANMHGGKNRDGSDLGRWPANVVIDEIAAAALDEQTGELVSGSRPAGTLQRLGEGNGYGGGAWERPSINNYDASVGGASRFYYCAKPSREERDFGCDDLPAEKVLIGAERHKVNPTTGKPVVDVPRRNGHPTVKPVELMRWLVRLVTPLDGLVLDPFLGSGTTGMACAYEHRRFTGIEREADYIAIAERRIAAVAPLFSDGAA